VSAIARGAVGRTLLGVAVFVLALGLWQVLAGDSFYFPPPGDVLGRAWVEWRTADFLAGAAASLTRLAAGFVIGAAVGIGVGLAMGSWSFAGRMLGPLTELLRATPAIAVVPVAIVLFGLGDAMYVSIIAFGVCFPVLIHTVEGVRAVPPEARDTASMLQVGGVARVLRIYLPSALPSIVAGLRVAVSIGLVLVVISELIGEADGLGRYIQLQSDVYAIKELYAGILFLGLLGYVLNRLFLAAERRVLAWHYGAAGEPVR
jgi:ABC-type nitrate/sulfonate/bicarbonate transport system permease component